MVRVCRNQSTPVCSAPCSHRESSIQLFSGRCFMPALPSKFLALKSSFTIKKILPTLDLAFLLCPAVFLVICFPVMAKASQPITDAQVRQQIIKESIASYPGNCPCPYNVARNGSRCGKRSAYSRPGGYSPICYEEDVTPEMVNRWRNRHK